MGDFKTVFKQLRLAKGMTQEQLAAALNTTRSRLSMYELGQREPDLEALEAIADFFNVDIDYLMGRTNKTTIVPESYYLDQDARDLAEFLHKNPKYKVLFDASRKVKPEDIDLVRQMLDRMGGAND